MRAPYETTVPRAGAALLAGAVAGMFLVLAGFLGFALWNLIASGRGLDPYLSGAASFTLIAAIVSFGAFGLGLIVLAAPLWWLLHRLGRRGWIDAIALGACLTFAVYVTPSAFGSLFPDSGSSYSESDNGGPVVHDNRLTSHGWHNLVENGALFACAGAVVGFVVWRVAYRPTGTPPRSRLETRVQP